MRRDKDNRGSLLKGREVPRYLEAGEPGHVDIEDKNIGSAIGQSFQHLQAVARFADYFGRALGVHIVKQLPQALPGRRFIIRDEQAQGSGAHGTSASPAGRSVKCGNSISTWNR